MLNNSIVVTHELHSVHIIIPSPC